MNDTQTSNTPILPIQPHYESPYTRAEKEAERTADEVRALLDYHGIPGGICRNRHERRKAAKLLRIHRLLGVLG